MEQFRDHDIEEAINSSVDNIIEQVLWHLSEEQELCRSQVLEIISECDRIETIACHLTMEQQLEVVEDGVDECGYGDLSFDLDTLRTELESYAVLFIHLLAESRTYGIFEELFDFMYEHDLEPEHMRNANNLGCFPHVAERDEGENCTVYEYRDVEEAENDIDVWELRLGRDASVYFEKWQRRAQ